MIGLATKVIIGESPPPIDLSKKKFDKVGVKVGVIGLIYKCYFMHKHRCEYQHIENDLIYQQPGASVFILQIVWS